MRTKLNVFGTISEAYGGSWRHLGEMVRLIWFPGLLYLIFSIASAFVNTESQFFLALALEAASLFLWPVIAVAWHRFILLGDVSAGAVHFSFGRPEALFLLVSVLLFLLLAPGIMLTMSTAMLQESSAAPLLSFFGLLLLLVGFYLFVRLTLLLPAAAIGAPLDPRLVLERTRGNFWRLVAVFLAPMLPLLICAILLGILLQGGPLLQVLAVIGLALVSIFFAVVNVAALSIAYRELVGTAGSEPPDPHIEPVI